VYLVQEQLDLEDQLLSQLSIQIRLTAAVKQHQQAAVTHRINRLVGTNTAPLVVDTD